MVLGGATSYPGQLLATASSLVFDGLVIAFTIQAQFLVATFRGGRQRHAQSCSRPSKGTCRSTERRRARRISVHEKSDAANSRQGQHSLADSW